MLQVDRDASSPALPLSWDQLSPGNPGKEPRPLVAALRLWGPSCLLVQVGTMLAVWGEGWHQSCEVTGQVWHTYD